MTAIVALSLRYGGWLGAGAILTALGYFGARLEALEAQERQENERLLKTKEI